jgi:S-adenosylmethionine hydrolase
MNEGTVITLLTDLGSQSTSVSVAKAIVIRYAPGTVIADISHDVTQYDLQQAAYLLLSAYKHFPRGTIHIVPVDIFNGDVPVILLVEKDDSYFIAPGNGILPLAFGEEESVRLCYEMKKPFSFADWMDNAGRVIENIRSGKSLPYKAHTPQVAPQLMQPKVMHDGIDCNILYIDRHQNVVLDITRTQFDALIKNRPFRIKALKHDITAISNNYNDVSEDMPLCRFNASGFLEIAVNHGAAATLLGLATDNTAAITYQTIKIFFAPRAVANAVAG